MGSAPLNARQNYFMKQLLKFIKPHVRQILLLMLLYALAAVCALFMPYVMSDMVENGVKNADLNYIYAKGGLMVGLALAALACALATNFVSSKFSSQLAVNMRKQVFNKVNTLTFEQFSNLGTGSLITRTTEDIGWMEETISQIPYVMITCPIMFIGGIVLSFKGDWVLPLILLGTSVIVLIVACVITGKMEQYWQRGDELADVQNRMVRERLSGIRVIRAFDKDAHEHDRTAKATSEMCNSFVRANTISGIVSPVSSLLLNVATVVIIYVGALRLPTSNTLVAVDVLATIQYVALIANAVLTLSWTISFVPHVKVSMRRICAVMDLPTDEANTSTGAVLSGDVNFQDVSFAYPNASENAISNLNFSAKDGEIIGVIGGTGSGKSTLVKLLLGFYSASGIRQMGGANYNETSAATIRDNVSVALQKSMIFEGSIAENVKMGNKDATDEQVWEALSIAQMEDFVRSKQEGLSFHLSQSGSNLSGGQKQRINIARTIIKPASVYIFDDSFSALDYLTEANLRKRLNKYLQGKTQVVVTQRAATAMRCDKVYVLEGGKVVGCGTHERLLQTCETYREIFQSQLGGGLHE